MRARLTERWVACTNPDCGWDTAIKLTCDECESPLDMEACVECRDVGLEARLRAAEQLAEALRFYADPATYFAIGFFPDPPSGDFMDDFDETELGTKPGKRARKALEAWEKE